jgi:hypothetical protein
MTSAYIYGTCGGTIRDSDFSSTYGIRINDADSSTLRNVRVHALHMNIQIDQGLIDIDGLLLDTANQAGTEAIGIGTGAIAKVTLRHATIVRHGSWTALSVNAYSVAAKASLIARDVVITGAGGTDILRQSSNGGVASVDIATSSYDPAKTIGVVGLPGPTDLTVADPGFVDPVAGNYALRADSPLVDHGEAALPAGLATTDLAGGARLVDGNGDGVARTDIGAYEYAPPAPPAPPAGPAAPAAPAGTAVPIANGTGTGRVARLTLSTTNASQRLDRRGRFAVRAACAAPGGCRGTVRLSARVGKRTVTFGRASLVLADGKATTLRIRLSAAGRRVLRAHRRVKITVAASARSGAGTALAARAAFSGRRR